MNEVENKKQTSESSVRPEKKKIYCRPRPYARFTPKLKEVTKLLQKSFPKLFTRKPEPSENNITEAELGKALGFWCYGWRYRKALVTGKRYDLNFNETPFYKEEITSETAAVPTLEVSSKRKKITYPENWAEVYSRWKNKEISFKVAMELTGLKQSTFYRLAKEYVEKNEK